jgi:hypothetical protein
MAVNANSWFSNSIPGAASIGLDSDIYISGSTPKYALGHKVERSDGSVYRYVHFGAAVSRGRVVAPNMNNAAYIYSQNAIIATSSAFQQSNEPTGMYPSMINSRYFAAILGTITADKYAGGYLVVSSGTGIGYTYRIKGNQVSNGTATIFELYDKIAVGMDATSDIAIGTCKYQDCQPALAATTNLALAVGVAVADQDLDDYGFIQTRGLIGVGQVGTLTTGSMATLSTAVAGQVIAYGQGAAASDTGSGLVPKLDVPVIGNVVLATATSGNALINLTLE